MMVGGLALAATWVIYPWLARHLVTKVGSRPKNGSGQEPTPARATVVFSVRNGIIALPEVLECLDARRAEYPGLRVAVADDASHDGSAELLANWCASRAWTWLRRSSEPCGKNFQLNHLVQSNPAEVYIFIDGNSLMQPGAVAALLEPIRSGCWVSVGRVLYRKSKAGSTTEEFYWARESRRFEEEAQRGILLQSNGGLFAAKADICDSLDPAASNDLEIPFRAAVAGRRIGYVRSSVVIEDAPSWDVGRRVRTARRAAYTVRAYWHRLPFWARRHVLFTKVMRQNTLAFLAIIGLGGVLTWPPAGILGMMLSILVIALPKTRSILGTVAGVQWGFIIGGVLGKSVIRW